MTKISTSILSSNERIECIQKLNNTNTDYIHIDVMDGKFVPNYQFSKEEIQKLLPYSNKPLDIHLMTENPDEYLDILNNQNIEFITIHLEIKQDIKKIIDKIKLKGYKVGISIKPETDIKEIIKYLDDIDLILIMSVNPGYGGQKFIPDTIDKLKAIKKYQKDFLIEIDGGINDSTIKLVKPYIDIAVAGSYIINNDNYNKAIINLKK